MAMWIRVGLRLDLVVGGLGGLGGELEASRWS